ncbi:hypothetical protein GCM10007973_02750 [Polymorphobacter multimanifer]|nr:hypothetical protein GCM10007973_02750 [Polymorphobacter multimanifer]
MTALATAMFSNVQLAEWAGREPAAVRRRVEAAERLLERVTVIPGTRIPVGLDALMGFIPVIGDLAAGAMGLYIVWEARNLGLPRWTIARMLANVGFDTMVGAVPLVGDAFDVLFRSNTKNLRLIKRHLDKHHPGTAVIDAL